MSGKAFLVILLLSLGVYSAYLYRQAADSRASQAALGKDLAACKGQSAELERQMIESQNSLAELRKRGNVIYGITLLVKLSPVAQSKQEEGTAAEPSSSVNLGAVATLNTGTEGEALRFTNPDLLATIENGEFAIVYEPENPGALFGQQIGALARYKNVNFSFASIFPLAGISVTAPASLSIELRVNNLAVAHKAVTLDEASAQGLQFSFDLSHELSEVEKLYTKALRAQARR